MTTDRDRVEKTISNYCPVGIDPAMWSAIAEPVRLWVRAAAPGHRRRALQLLYATAHLASWCASHSIPVTETAALRDTTVERFCASAERDGRFSRTTRATVRAHLRCVASANAVAGNRPPPPRLARSRVRPPYSSAEVSSYMILARTQSSHSRRRHLLALLCAGLGAGLGPDDLRDLRGTDVERDEDGAVTVAVRGRRPRSVIVLEDYGPELLRLAGESEDRLLLGGHKVDRRSVTTSLLSHIEGGADLPRLEPGRLRSTWICTLLRGAVRIDVVMEAAGLDSATTLGDLVRQIEPQCLGLVRTQLQWGQAINRSDQHGCAQCAKQRSSDGSGHD